MIIDVVSDLHVDRNPDPINWQTLKTSSADTLIVAGDNASDPDLSLRVLVDAKQYYAKIICVLGNHDHTYCHNKNVYEIVDYFRNSLKQYSENIHLLTANSPCLLDDVAFIGDCAWYDWKSHIAEGISFDDACSAWIRYAKDMYRIDFSNTSPVELAHFQASELYTVYERLQNDPAVKTIVCVTHTCPHKKFATYPIPDEMKGLSSSYVNTELSKIYENNRNGKLKYWIFGHTHALYNDIWYGVRFINNSRGLPGERPGGWNVVTIDV